MATLKSYCSNAHSGFPDLSQANDEGLLAMGGDLSPERLQCAYSLGIFPWFEQGQPILWWSPDPRCVLYPADFKTSRSLKKNIRSSSFEISFDDAFEKVIEACAMPRIINKKTDHKADHTVDDKAEETEGAPNTEAESGTWITPEMREAYMRLHQLGLAHSVEVWQQGKLVGGLYGVMLGHMFYGESMFSQVRDASKFALKSLCEKLIEKEHCLIDCQVESKHLLSLGAKSIPRQQFIKVMQQALPYNQSFK